MTALILFIPSMVVLTWIIFTFCKAFAKESRRVKAELDDMKKLVQELEADDRQFDAVMERNRTIENLPARASSAQELLAQCNFWTTGDQHTNNFVREHCKPRLTSGAIGGVIRKFERLIADNGENFPVNMHNGWTSPPSWEYNELSRLASHCHAGYYHLANEWDARRAHDRMRRRHNARFAVGAEQMAEDLGLGHPQLLMLWAEQNPDLWGNEHGYNMFSCERAFFTGVQPSNIRIHDSQLTLQMVLDHWKGVYERVRKREYESWFEDIKKSNAQVERNKTFTSEVLGGVPEIAAEASVDEEALEIELDVLGINDKIPLACNTEWDHKDVQNR